MQVDYLQLVYNKTQVLEELQQKVPADTTPTQSRLYYNTATPGEWTRKSDAYDLDVGMVNWGQCTSDYQGYTAVTSLNMLSEDYYSIVRNKVYVKTDKRIDRDLSMFYLGGVGMRDAICHKRYDRDHFLTAGMFWFQDDAKMDLYIHQDFFRIFTVTPEFLFESVGFEEVGDTVLYRGVGNLNTTLMTTYLGVG